MSVGELELPPDLNGTDEYPRRRLSRTLQPELQPNCETLKTLDPLPYMVIEQVAVSVRGLFLHPFPPHDDGCSRPIWLKCLFRQNDEGFVTGKQLAVPLQRKRQKTAHLADVSHLEIRWSVVGQLFVTCFPVLHMKTRADDGNGR